MGSRARRDPAGHQRRGKGAPTPDAPQNAAAPPQGAPPAVHVVFAESFAAGITAHPAIVGPVLDLHFALPGGSGRFTARLPLDAWPHIVTQVDGLLADHAAKAPDQAAATRASAAGIHLPGGIDLEAEARAHQQIKEGPAT